MIKRIPRQESFEKSQNLNEQETASTVKLSAVTAELTAAAKIRTPPATGYESPSVNHHQSVDNKIIHKTHIHITDQLHHIT